MWTITNRIFAFVSWALIITLSAYFFIDNVLAYFYGYRSRLFGSNFFHNQVWVVSHMAGGTLTLVTGPLQFSKYLRIKQPSLHRLLGKVYLLGIGLAGLSALRLSIISSCVPCRISLFLLSVLAILTSFFAWKAIRAGNIKAHRQFMVRSYICVLAFVAVRIDGIFPLDFMFGNIDDPLLRRVVNEYFFSFVPLLFAELFMVWIPAVYPARLGRR
ncbi:MAG TPA: DUF2306 domain-containing protein [Flavisolibacter sp.]|nr:DUF2306 domain-containing protein [Flavisolibacter sp.]